MSFSIPPYLLPKHHRSTAAAAAAATFSSPLSRRSSALPGVVDTIHALLPPPLVSRGGRGGVRCSSLFPRGSSFGTVDFENNGELNQWLSLYWRVSKMDPNMDVTMVLEKWEADQQRQILKGEAFRVAKHLRKFRRFKSALDVYEWMLAQGRFSFNSSDAAIHLDLIAKVRGISSAEEYFGNLSEEHRDKRSYAALLNVYVRVKEKRKAEAVLETMRNRGFLTDALSYNVMMTLYRALREHEKVFSLIKEMREKEIIFDEYSFNIWITTCAAAGDVEGIDRISHMLDTTDEHLYANWSVFSTLATQYIRQGNIAKAELYVKETKSRLTRRDRLGFERLIILYGLLHNQEEAYETWQIYKSYFPITRNNGFHAMISALLHFGDIEGAESIFQEWLSTAKRYDSRICNILLLYYLNNGHQIAKAERCLDDFCSRGGKPTATTCEILAEAYIANKNISEALSMLKAAASAFKEKNEGRWKPRAATVADFRALCEEQNDMASLESLKMVGELEFLDNDESASPIQPQA